MYRCHKCGDVVGPAVTAIIVPTGYHDNGRSGEAMLCDRCHREYEDKIEDIVHTKHGIVYSYFVSK